jgi:hypothetical protein
MPESKPAEVLIVASSSASARARTLATALELRGVAALLWKPAKERETSGEAFAEMAGPARAIVLFADQALLNGAGKSLFSLRALAGARDRLVVVVVEPCPLDEIARSCADVLPARGSLADLRAPAEKHLFDQLVHEVLAEIDASYAPQAASHVDEYRLLVESTERQVDRRKAATPTFLAVNAAIIGLITFVSKDLSIGGARLALALAPLLLVGALACRTWQRTIRQYEELIDWRYRQLRRIERRGLAGSYRLFGREWDAIYAPRPGGAFGFSNLETAVPNVFLALYIAGLACVIAYAAAGLSRS